MDAEDLVPYTLDEAITGLENQKAGRILATFNDIAHKNDTYPRSYSKEIFNALLERSNWDASMRPAPSLGKETGIYRQEVKEQIREQVAMGEYSSPLMEEYGRLEALIGASTTFNWEYMNEVINRMDEEQRRSLEQEVSDLEGELDEEDQSVAARLKFDHKVSLLEDEEPIRDIRSAGLGERVESIYDKLWGLAEFYSEHGLDENKCSEGAQGRRAYTFFIYYTLFNPEKELTDFAAGNDELIDAFEAEWKGFSKLREES